MFVEDKLKEKMMKKCPILKVECDSDAPCCEKCTLYIEYQIKQEK